MPRAINTKPTTTRGEKGGLLSSFTSILHFSLRSSRVCLRAFSANGRLPPVNVNLASAGGADNATIPPADKMTISPNQVSHAAS